MMADKRIAGADPSDSNPSGELRAQLLHGPVTPPPMPQAIMRHLIHSTRSLQAQFSSPHLSSSPAYLSAQPAPHHKPGTIAVVGAAAPQSPPRGFARDAVTSSARFPLAVQLGHLLTGQHRIARAENNVPGRRKARSLRRSASRGLSPPGCCLEGSNRRFGPLPVSSSTLDPNHSGSPTFGSYASGQGGTPSLSQGLADRGPSGAGHRTGRPVLITRHGLLSAWGPGRPLLPSSIGAVEVRAPTSNP